MLRSCHFLFCGALCVGTLLGTMAGSAAPRDYGKLTCGDFVASGEVNMAPLIMWLRGYHAGKTGMTTYDTADPYPGRLGHYCGNHHAANLLETSEHILSEIDRGI